MAVKLATSQTMSGTAPKDYTRGEVSQARQELIEQSKLNGLNQAKTEEKQESAKDKRAREKDFRKQQKSLRKISKLQNKNKGYKRSKAEFEGKRDGFFEGLKELGGKPALYGAAIAVGAVVLAATPLGATLGIAGLAKLGFVNTVGAIIGVSAASGITSTVAQSMELGNMVAREGKERLKSAKEEFYENTLQSMDLQAEIALEQGNAVELLKHINNNDLSIRPETFNRLLDEANLKYDFETHEFYPASEQRVVQQTTQNVNSINQRQSVSENASPEQVTTEAKIQKGGTGNAQDLYQTFNQVFKYNNEVGNNFDTNKLEDVLALMYSALAVNEPGQTRVTNVPGVDDKMFPMPDYNLAIGGKGPQDFVEHMKVFQDIYNQMASKNDKLNPNIRFADEAGKTNDSLFQEMQKQSYLKELTFLLDRQEQYLIDNKKMDRETASNTVYTSMESHRDNPDNSDQKSLYKIATSVAAPRTSGEVKNSILLSRINENVLAHTDEQLAKLPQEAKQRQSEQLLKNYAAFKQNGGSDNVIVEGVQQRLEAAAAERSLTLEEVAKHGPAPKFKGDDDRPSTVSTKSSTMAMESLARSITNSDEGSALDDEQRLNASRQLVKFHKEQTNESPVKLSADGKFGLHQAQKLVEIDKRQMMEEVENLRMKAERVKDSPLILTESAREVTNNSAEMAAFEAAQDYAEIYGAEDFTPEQQQFLAGYLTKSVNEQSIEPSIIDTSSYNEQQIAELAAQFERDQQMSGSRR